MHLYIERRAVEVMHTDAAVYGDLEDPVNSRPERSRPLPGSESRLR